MRIIKTCLKQKAVYWAPAGPGEDHQQTYTAPVELKVRWVDVSAEFVDYTGIKAMSQAQVMTEKDVVIEGVLWLGRFVNLTSPSDPFANAGAFEIRRFDKIPTLNGKQFVRKATLGTQRASSMV